MSRVARLCIALSTFAGFVVPAAAQDYPTRTVRIIVPFGAGGPADIYARFLGQQLQETLKQTFVIEDRPGAGSIIGTGEVAKSPPDGYTLLMMSNTHTTNETLRPNKPFQLMRDFVAVAPVNYSDLIMVIHPSVAAKVERAVGLRTIPVDFNAAEREAIVRSVAHRAPQFSELYDALRGELKRQRAERH